jgi:organic hydroperoxide reductase OsmC/OhrA
MSADRVRVELECFENNDVVIHFGSEVLPDIVLAKSKFPQEKLGGEARALLAASVAECMVSWLTYLLGRARVKVGFLKASAEAVTGLNEDGQNVVKEVYVKIDLKVDGDGGSYQRFERIRNLLLRQGCLISRSLEKGIRVTFSIECVRGGEK